MSSKFMDYYWLKGAHRINGVMLKVSIPKVNKYKSSFL
ncbi:hypothetical protein NRI_0304 [Neorickettsia risticii str. Illinois]|uniref:Uncharacterized protein n=1 Tax=Neorickettsia risticii (strain Illinois) TaxID=434131 RepID=C6V4H5_NEORI|nr:hypothetical protein NRI_0304 [Neorickettsia risticii str. Illinois]